MKKKRQHIIPKCYLKSWCDPECPPRHEPHVWIISKNGSEAKKKSPKKTLTETDMYTIKLPDGTRNLMIEDTLSHIETVFVRIVNNTIKKGLPLSSQEKAHICTFVASMSARTKWQQENFDKTFTEVHEMVESMEKQHKAQPTTSLETRVWKDYGSRLIIERVLKSMTPILFQMSMAILTINDEIGFITSDHPCVWFNPEMHKWPPFYRHPGLGQKKIEVTLPLTPSHLVVFTWSNIKGYIPIKLHMVDEMNRRTRGLCEHIFISRKNETKPIWFEMG